MTMPEIPFKLQRQVPNNDGEYLNDIDFTEFTLKTSVHFINLSGVPIILLSPISNVLKSNGFVQEVCYLTSMSKYLKMRRFRDGIIVIDIFYGMRIEAIRYDMLIKIYNPNKEILELFERYFTKVSIIPSVSKLELTFDFISDHPNEFKIFLEKHFFLRYQRKESFSIESEDGRTTYPTDTRTSSKGARIYQKEVYGRDVVRLELVLNRRAIRRTGLGFPVDIDAIDLSKFFRFVFLEEKKLSKYIKNHKINNKVPRKRKLLERQIDSWVNSLLTYYDLMTQVERLKSKDKGLGITYSNFLTKHYSFIDKFNDEITKQSFIPVTNKVYQMPLFTE